MIKQGRHQTPTDEATKARRKLAGVPIFGWMFMAVGGVAVAAWIIANSIVGTVSTTDVDVDYSYATVGDPVNIDFGTCTGTYSGLDEITLAWSNTLGGDTCQPSAAFTTGGTNTRDVALQAFTGLPAGITGELEAHCGMIFPAGETATYTASVLLTIDSATATPGTSYDLAGAQFEWVPANQYDPLLCN